MKKFVSDHMPKEFTMWLLEWLDKKDQPFIIFGTKRRGHVSLRYEENLPVVKATIKSHHQNLASYIAHKEVQREFRSMNRRLARKTPK